MLNISGLIESVDQRIFKLVFGSKEKYVLYNNTLIIIQIKSTR